MQLPTTRVIHCVRLRSNLQFALHGSLTNTSQAPDERMRFSIDVRFQPASHPWDLRYSVDGVGHDGKLVGERAGYHGGHPLEQVDGPNRLGQGPVAVATSLSSVRTTFPRRASSSTLTTPTFSVGSLPVLQRT